MGTIWNSLSSPISLLVVLTIVVFIHELGHFLVARWCGVKVQAFSIGFGREICGFTDRQGTRWKLAWIPLGGYVRFADDDNSASVASRDKLEQMSAAERDGAFQTKPLHQKAAVVIAGPAFNIVSAVVFLFCTFWLLGVDGHPARIDTVRAGSPAENAGVKPGDLVVEANGQSVYRWVELQREINRNANYPVALVLDRDGKRVVTTVTPVRRESPSLLGGVIEMGDIGIGASIPARVGRVQPDSAAMTAGLQTDDRILAIDSKPIRHFADLQQIIGANTGTEIVILVQRGTEQLKLTARPEPIGDGRPGRRIGISPKGDPDVRYGALESARFSVSELVFFTEEIFRGIPRLPGAIAKVLSFEKQDQLGGPIAIAEMSKYAVESGWSGFVSWIAIFSIMLGVMNLLPIPLLDGGHLMFYALEAIRGKPLNERNQEIGFKIGMAVLGTMMFAAILGDIMRKLGLV